MENNTAQLEARVQKLESQGQRPAGGGAATLAFASTVVWRPGTVSSGNVYATWPEVVAAVSKINGAVTIGVDPSHAPATIPAGAWDLRPGVISGPVTLVNADKTGGFGGGAFVTIAAAAVTIHGLTGLDAILIDNNSTLDVLTSTAAEQIVFRMRASSLFQDAVPGGPAFFKVTGGIGFFIMDDQSLISTLGAGTRALQSVAPGTLSLQLNDLSAIGTNQLDAPGGTAGVQIGGLSQANFITSYPTQANAPTIVPFGLVIKGSSAIVAGTGKTAAIPAFLESRSVILVSLKTPVGDANTVKYAALAADRVTGNPGSFQISALLAAGGGATNGADTSTIDWEVRT